MARLLRRGGLGAIAGVLLLLGLLVSTGPALAAGSITISPSSGPAGTAITITGSGFTPGPVVVTVQGPTGTTGRDTFTIGSDGALKVSYDTTGDAAGSYTVLVNGGAGTQGILLAQGTFTITAGGTPGMPSTGGGYAAQADKSPAPAALAGLTLGALALLLYRGHRARRAA